MQCFICVRQHTNQILLSDYFLFHFAAEFLFLTSWDSSQEL